MKVSDIKLNPNNPRKIDETKLEKLCQSITDFPKMMTLRPIIIDGEGVILGGNMRYKALKKLGYKELPNEWVKRADELTEEEKKRFIIEDNVSFGEWDIDLSEWDVADLKNWGLEMPEWMQEQELDKKEIIEDEAPTPEDIKKPTAKLGDIWQLGDHRLICGDSTIAETFNNLMGNNTADLCITDPPYNVDYENKNKALDKFRKGNSKRTHNEINNDNKSPEFFFNFLCKSFKNIEINLKQGGVFYVWFGSKEHVNFENALNNNNLEVRQELIWNKNQFVIGRQDYQWKHESCLYGWKDGASHYFIDDRTFTTIIEDKGIDYKKLSKAEAIQMLKTMLEDKISTTVIDEKKPMSSDLHPTMKPVSLIARLMKNSSKINGVVLDPFGGSGTTLIACEQLKRKCFMIEFDPIYCDVIIKRWENLTGKKAVKL